MHDNLFKDRVTWGHSYGCYIDFLQGLSRAALDLSAVTFLQMDFRLNYGDALPLFSLTAGSGLTWQNNDPTTGSLQIAITRNQTKLVTFNDLSIVGAEVPKTVIRGDLIILVGQNQDLVFDEGSVPKLFLTVEQQISSM